MTSFGSGGTIAPAAPGRNRLRLRFPLPFGKASSLFGLFNFLQTRFGKLHITIEAEEGSLSESEIEDKVRETFRQIGTDVEIE
ncbi:MAG: hypothetical protein KatS3mg051_1785 [Anaerolineae bacterium]|nr:MAG: hypothetical protein KatS3mg051_1785 [Anaerolineae bacterium]